MLTQTLSVIGLFFVAQVLIFSGILFIAGKFLPTLLADVYTQFGTLWRLCVMVVVCSVPANLLIAKAFQIAPASLAGAVNMASVVLFSVAVALLVDGVRPNWQVFAATALVLVGAVWVVVALKG
jgi:drug/metabolite transporter (DMT)-like permease